MQIVAGRYRLERVLGKGNQGTVYLASDLSLSRQVALKTVSLGGLRAAGRAEACRSFLREGRILAGLQHPALAQVLDCFIDGGVPWLVMQRVDGRDLATVARTHPGRLSPEVVLSWAEDLADALDYLHSRRPPVLFLDLKPGNAMLDRSGRVVLVDFGIACRLGAPGPTTSLVSGMGTPGFAALEQYAGQPEPRSDIHALGATLFTLLAGEAPPDAAARAAGTASLPSLGSLHSGVPPAAERVLADLMALRPEKRPFPARAAVRELATAFREPASRERTPAFCPYRDGALAVPEATVETPAQAVAYRGPEPLARRAASLAQGSGLRALAIPGERSGNPGPTPWIVLVAPG